MPPDYTKPLCSRCIRRPAEQGGRGNCPFPEKVQERLAKLPEGEFSCASYKPGQKRPKPEPTELPEPLL